jgi:serine/threonine protein kinase
MDAPAIQGTLARPHSLLSKAKRYCQLIGNQFFIFKAPSYSELEDVFEITSACKIETQDAWRFRIVLPYADAVVLQAETPDEMARWLFALRSCAFSNQKMSMEQLTFVAVLGRGHYAKVSLYRHCETGELIAMKTISKARMIENRRVKFVMAERNILAKAHHPFVIRLKFAFQTPTKFYLGLEYARGGDLFHHLEISLALPVADAKFYIAEIACALNYLHSLGVIYRDLKPENVLFDGDGHIKLADFGLSCELGGDLTATSICGTLDYLPPEVIQKRPYSFALDWWSLGVVAYQMLFGRRPFSGDGRADTARLCQRIVGTRPAYRPDVGRDVVAFLDLLLEKDAAKRGDFEAIRNADLFRGMDWQALEERRIAPPFVPSGDDGLANFDAAFSPDVPDSSDQWRGAAARAPTIPGFSYTELVIDPERPQGDPSLLCSGN